MSKTDPGDQVKFLVSCIGHTSNGRPDFQAVADELEIVSKAAAQKRYERLLKSHGIKPRVGSAPSGPATPAAAKEKPTPRKRKVKDADESPLASATKKRTRAPRPKKEDTEDEELESKPKVEDEKQASESGALTESSLSAAPLDSDDEV